MADKTTTYSDEGLQPQGTADDRPAFQPLSLSIDWELYASYLEASDLSDDEKRECIEALWKIVVSFVDLGFGIAPVQVACEQNQNSTLRLPTDLLSSGKSNPNTTSETHADETPSHSAEREES